MVLFTFMLLPRDNKLIILEQIKQALIEGDLVEDVYRYSQGYIDEGSWVKYLNFAKRNPEERKNVKLK